MEYENLSKQLEEIEKRAEEEEENAAPNQKKPDSGSAGSHKNTAPSAAAVSRTVTTGIRRVVCSGISKIAEALFRWDMTGYSDRVDKDEILCDAFHTVAEKRAPAIITQSPEAVVVIGLSGHAYATGRSNREKARESGLRATYTATPENGIGIEVTEDVPSRAPPACNMADDYPIDLDSRGEPLENYTETDDDALHVADVPTTGVKRRREHRQRAAAHGERRPKRRRLTSSCADDECDDDADDSLL